MGSQDLFFKTYDELKRRILYGMYPHKYHLVVGSLSKGASHLWTCCE